MTKKLIKILNSTATFEKYAFFFCSLQIVWDEDSKKWLNKDEDGDTSSASLAPPPKAADMSLQQPRMTPQMPQANSPNVTLGNPGGNMFKLQKGRSMKSNYVNAWNSSGGTTANSPMIPTPATSPMIPQAASSPQLFVPSQGIVIFIINKMF